MWVECVVSIAVAIISVCLTEFFVYRRESNDRRKQTKMKFLEDYGENLAIIEKQLFEISREVDNCLAKNNPQERLAAYNNIRIQLSKFNESNCVLFFKVSCFTKANNVSWSIEDHKHYIGECADALVKILDKYISKSDTSEATAEINKCIESARKQIHIEIEIVADNLAALIK